MQYLQLLSRKITLLLFAFFLAPTHPAKAQKAVTDSLLLRYRNEKNDTEQVRLLIQAAYRLQGSDTAESKRCVERVDSIALKTGKAFFTAQYHFLKGALLINTAPQESIAELEKAVRGFEAYPDNRRAMLTLASCYINLGVIHANSQDYNSALQYYRQAEPRLLKWEPRNSDLGLVYSNLAIAYGALSRYDEGIVYSKKGLDWARLYKDKYQLMAAYYAHGGTLAAKPKNNEGLLMLDSALTLAKELNNIDFMYSIQNMKGMYYYNTKQYSEAIREYNNCLAIVRQFNYGPGIGTAYLNMAAQEAELKQPRIAAAHLDSAARYLDLKTPTAAKQMYFENYAEVYRQLGQYEKAFAYKDSVGVIKDSVYNADNIRQAEFRQARFNYEKAQNENFRLQKEKEVQALSLKQKNLQNGLLAGGLLAAAVIGLLFYRNSRNKQLLQQKQIESLQQEKQLMATEAVLKGEEQERARLARDLHDGLGGMLSGIKFSLNNIKGNLTLTQENAASFDKSIDMLNSSIQEMRRVAHNMMPEALVKFGLDSALHDFCEDLLLSGSPKITYQSVGLSGSDLPQSISIAVYRMVQELVNNVLKHAQANTILVQLAVSEYDLTITVEDDGIGFTPDKTANSGIGLKNIRNRVDFLKGTIDYQSAPGKGTSVLIEIPLPNAK